MNGSQRSLTIDMRVGGLGDLWMRSVAFYSLAVVFPTVAISLIVPAKLLRFFEFVFGDRLRFSSQKTRVDIAYTNLGFRHLFFPALSGRRFVSPYARAVIRDRQENSIKNRLNSFLLTVTDAVNVISTPPASAIDEYQGYLEIAGIKEFRKLSTREYYDQAELDFPVISDRCLGDGLPISDGLIVPDSLAGSTLVFPTGTSRTFIPARWAKRYFPEAMFAFFDGDPDRTEYEKLSLKTISYYKEAGDIIYLARHANRVIATDSFCSHLVQFTIPTATILLTELARERIVSPSFRGRVVQSLAPCHPCLKRARGSFDHCQAGHTECLNWSNESYAANVGETGILEQT